MSLSEIHINKKPSGCSTCLYSTIGEGFCPDHYPPNPVVSGLAEAAGSDEILTREPLTGGTGRLFTRLAQRAGFERQDMVLGNVLRCHPPGNVYPIGQLRKQAEAACRQYDRVAGLGLTSPGRADFGADHNLLTIHPAASLRNWTLTRIIQEDLKKARRLVDRGLKLNIIMGDKPKELVFPHNYAGGILKTRGTWDGPTARDSYPPILKGPEAVYSVMREAAEEGLIGHDSEFVSDTLQATVFGVASTKRCAAWWWDNAFAQKMIDYGVPISAYSCLGADKPVLERMLGIKTPLSIWSDPMLKWWACYPDLASVPKSSFSEDEAESTGLGFMGLWACTSILHDWPNWKRCIGAQQCQQERRPCPEHDVLGYCAMDSFAGLADDYTLDAKMRELAIPQSYYEWRRELAEYCVWMQTKGSRVDMSVIDVLEETMESKKLALFPYEMIAKPPKVFKNGKVHEYKPEKTWVGPFNPNSTKQKLEWFDAHGISLRARGGKPSTGKKVLITALNKHLRPFGLKFNEKKAELESLTPKIEGLTDPEELDQPLEKPDLPEPVEMLFRLLQKATLGKGLSSWFDRKYITNGRVHPRFNPCGTSTGRLSSGSPNFQNVPRIGFGAEVRKAIVAEPGCVLAKCDYSQLEFRMCLWFAGVDPASADGTFEDLLAKANGMIPNRDAAKSVVHAGDYMEGLKLYKPRELDETKLQRERACGALEVFEDWTYKGRLVCFTGSNLSERLFGDRTRENRKKALLVQSLYLDKFPAIRQWQRKVTQEIERDGYVRLPGGHRVDLYGREPEDNLKFAMALYGQGGGAIYAQEGVLRLKALGRVMSAQIHDESLFTDIPEDWDLQRIKDFFHPMVVPSEIMLGFTCPAKLSVGLNWGDAEEVGILRWQGK